MTLEETITAAIRLILPDVQTTGIATDDGASEWLDDTASVTFTKIGYLRQGVDERRYTVEGDSLRERVYGNRTLRVQFTCETDRQTLELTADELADTLIAGFERTDVEELFAALDLGIPACLPVRQVNYPNAHGDIRSAAVFEAQFPASRRHTGGLIAPILEIVVNDLDVGPV